MTNRVNDSAFTKSECHFQEIVPVTEKYGYCIYPIVWERRFVLLYGYDSDYPFGIFKLFLCAVPFYIKRLLIGLAALRAILN